MIRVSNRMFYLLFVQSLKVIFGLQFCAQRLIVRYFNALQIFASPIPPVPPSATQQPSTPRLLAASYLHNSDTLRRLKQNGILLSHHITAFKMVQKFGIVDILYSLAHSNLSPAAIFI